MQIWKAVLLALLSAAVASAVPVRAAQAQADPWTCVEQHLEELGYRMAETDTSGAVRHAERRILSSMGLAREAVGIAARLSMQFRPEVEREFDQLNLQRDRYGRLRVAAARITTRGSQRAESRPRARALKDAMVVMARCGGPEPSSE